MDNDPRIIVALDYPTAEQALQFVDRTDPALCRLKVGKELFTVAGPQLVGQLVERGYGVFLDLKFHDIPNTVAGAIRSAARLGVWMVNVHASGGRRMMTAAREALDGFAQPPKLIAVTMLTSMGEADLADLGLTGSVGDNVLRLARLTRDCGLDGVVCSAQEAPMLKSELGKTFQLVTPGIRPAQAAKDDQTRVVTAGEAVRLGADYLVVGRPVTQAADPLLALKQLNEEIKGH